MPARRDILLTGATGFLGRYLLRDLMARGRRVVALVRGSPEAAADRIAELTALWSNQLAADLPQPLVVSGDLKSAGLGLDEADRRRVGRCGAVLHAAAQVAFHHSPDGEPWATNVEGTRRLLELCHAVRLSEFHHVSTAFVCGDRTDKVYEDQLECGQRFHNDYERSKYEAERLIRMARRVHATFYRPTVIVGDSRTGYTSSYHGLYPFLELADRVAESSSRIRQNAGATTRILANAATTLPPRQLALRMPFTGEEARNLVPVDWVSQAIVRLVHLPRWHGRTFHLAAKKPIRMNEIKEAAEAGLGVEGVQWVGSADPIRPSRLEQVFYDHVRAYWPYLNGDPAFDCRNTRAALRWFPSPRVNQALLARLIRFALADRWGQKSRARAPARPSNWIARITWNASCRRTRAARRWPRSSP